MTQLTIPSCLPAEEALLSCYVRDNRLIGIYPLDSDEFYSEVNRKIARAIFTITRSGQDATLTTIGAWLHSNGNQLEAIGPMKLADVLQSSGTTVGAEHHWRNIRNAAHIRRFIDAASTYAQKAMECAFDGTADIAEDINGLVSQFKIAASPKAGMSLSMVHLGSVSTKVLSDIESAMESGTSSEHAPIPTGLREVDEQLDGGIPPGMTVIGARTSHGKSAVALAIAEHASSLERGCVAYFSFEMTKEAIFYRLLSWRTGIAVADLRAGRLSRSQIHHVRAVNDTICNLELYGQSTEGRMTADQVGRAVDDLMGRQKVALVIVDYIQILAAPRNVQIGTDAVRYASGSLQQLAYRSGVPVVVLSQCNRDSEKSDRPRLHQLADSTALENDADCVMILHRPGKDDPTKPNNEIDVHVDKMRSGRIGSVKVSWDTRTGHPLSFRQPTRYGDARGGFF